VGIEAPAVDLTAIRALFEPGPGIAYLDTATYGLPPRPTIQALERALRAWQAGEGDWIEDWDRPTDRVRGDFAALIGADASEVATIPAASVGVGLVAAGLGARDEVVVPVDEFTSTLFPLLVAKERGARVREVPFDAVADSVASGTTLVATSLVQMQTGRLADMASICEAAERYGARVLVDATQGIPFVDLDLVGPRIDYLVCSAYKHLLSPRGTAFLRVLPRHWNDMQPLNANWRSAVDPYARYFGGPLSLATDAARFDVSRAWFPWVGAVESLRLLAEWKRAGTFASVLTLAEGLAHRLGVRWEGATLVCAPIGDGETARLALRAKGIRASVRGTGIRFAVHVYTTEADLDRASDAIAPFLESR
jgi:selenocysteine lyase/cysteine desulfurase